jgi:hypothetical protein
VSRSHLPEAPGTPLGRRSVPNVTVRKSKLARDWRLAQMKSPWHAWRSVGARGCALLDLCARDRAGQKPCMRQVAGRLTSMNFLGLNNSSLTVPVGTPIISGDVVTITNRDVQTLTVGVNYLFNWH